jgi:nucleotide sugar dehydrogenase
MKIRAKISLIKSSASIKQAMCVIQEQPHKAPDAPSGIVLVVDHRKKLLGIATDGDIRRSLLAGASMEDRVSKIMNRRPITFHKDLTPDEILSKTITEINNRKIGNKRLDTIITVDDEGRPYDVFCFFELWKRSEVKTRVVSIIGLGYVGLTLGLMLAEAGFQVVGVDRNRELVRELNRGQLRVHEQGLDDLLRRHLKKKFFVKHNFKNNDSDIYIVCVGTPINRKGKADYGHLQDALHYLTGVLKKGDLVTLRSTVSVGTCRKIVIPFLERKTGLRAGEDFYVSFAPERTAEGRALGELRELPQVIGGLNKPSFDLTAKLFNNITSSIVSVENLESAELVKLLNNSYRDLTFAFANEVALICDGLHLNSKKVIQAANYGYDRSAIPYPSPGVGGYCLPKDSYLLVDSARKGKVRARLPRLSRQINEQMIEYVCGKVNDFVNQHNLQKSRVKIFVIGMAFKGEPETRDTRGSTAVSIASRLAKTYPKLYAFDPVMNRKAIRDLGFRYASLQQGIKGADCVLILNNHKSYRDIPVRLFSSLMHKPAFLFDAWYILGELVAESIPDISYRGM